MPRGIYKRTPENTARYWLGKKRGEHSPEVKEKLRVAMKGRIFSDESKKKMSISQMGKKGTYGHLGKKHSLETRNKLGIKGENNHFWKGGITKQNALIRSSLEYKLWREAVFARDNYTCIWCGKKSGNGYTVVLNADHIKPFSLYPELRFALDNGRTLCKECHMTTDSYFGNFKKNYK